MSWFIDDFSRTEIFITDGWNQYFIPKFRIHMYVSEPILYLTWSDQERGGHQPHQLQLNYNDVVDNYSGYIDNPVSAQDLADQIEDMIDSAWTDISGGGELTDDELDAIQGADNPNAGNVFMTESAVLALLASSGILFTPDLFSDEQELGIGTNRTLASLGYDNAEAAIAWPRVAADPRFTIEVTTMFIDWIALQETFLAMEETCNSFLYSPGGRAYMTNQICFIPRNQNNWSGSGSAGTRSLDKFEFFFSGSGVFNGTDINFPVFDRFPADQTEAVNDLLNTTFIFHNLYIGGNDNDLADVNNIAFRLAATTKSRFIDCTFVNATVGMALYFGIGCEFQNCQYFNWGTYGLLLSNGRDGDAFGGGWSGGGTSDCQTNQTIDSNSRYVLTTNTSLAAVHQFGGYRPKIVNPIVEGIGGDPETVHLFHYLASGDGVEQLFDIEGLSVENLTCTRAGIRAEAEKGITHIGKCALYLGDPDTQMPVFIEGDNRTGSSSEPTIHIEKQDVNRPNRSIENTATPSFQYRWVFYHAAAEDPSDIYDPANWATDFSGFVPDTGFVCWTDMSNCGGGSGTPQDLADVLAEGNTTGGTDISVDSGDDIILNGETASRVAIIDASKMIKSADTATYPTLAELAFVKGVTSAIQTQLNTKYNVLFAQFLSTNPSNNTTRYFGNHPRALQGSADQSKIYIRTAGTIKIAEFYTYANGTAGTNENISLNIRLNNATDTLIQTVGVAAAERIFTNSGLAVAVVAGDYIELKIVFPTWATPPTQVTCGGNIYIQ